MLIRMVEDIGAVDDGSDGSDEIDGEENEKGKWCLQNLLLRLESISMAFMSRYFGILKVEVYEVLDCEEGD